MRGGFNSRFNLISHLIILVVPQFYLQITINNIILLWNMLIFFNLFYSNNHKSFTMNNILHSPAWVVTKEYYPNQLWGLEELVSIVNPPTSCRSLCMTLECIDQCKAKSFETEYQYCINTHNKLDKYEARLKCDEQFLGYSVGERTTYDFMTRLLHLCYNDIQLDEKLWDTCVMHTTGSTKETLDSVKQCQLSDCKGEEMVKCWGRCLRPMLRDLVTLQGNYSLRNTQNIYLILFFYNGKSRGSFSFT